MRSGAHAVVSTMRVDCPKCHSAGSVVRGRCQICDASVFEPAPEGAVVRSLFECPDCGGDRLEAVSDGELTNFRCTSCGSCWHLELGWVSRVDPVACLACPHREECLARQTSGAPAGVGWNVVVTLRNDDCAHVWRVLERLGPVAQTRFYNVLLMRIDDIPTFLASLDRLLAEDTRLGRAVLHILPLTHTFEFRDVAEFERRVREVALGWLDQLVGRSFFVRLHRRGFGDEISRHAEERGLDGALLDALRARGTPGTIDFEKPDVVIDIEAVGQRAGMALWTHDDLERHPFLRIR